MFSCTLNLNYVLKHKGCKCKYKREYLIIFYNFSFSILEKKVLFIFTSMYLEMLEYVIWYDMILIIDVSNFYKVFLRTFFPFFKDLA